MQGSTFLSNDRHFYDIFNTTGFHIIMILKISPYDKASGFGEKRIFYRIKVFGGKSF